MRGGLKLLPHLGETRPRYAGRSQMTKADRKRKKEAKAKNKVKNKTGKTKAKAMARAAPSSNINPIDEANQCMHIK